MHLLPAFLLIVALVIAWKWELVDGIILTIMGLAFSTGVFLLNMKRIHSVGKSLGIASMLCLPFVISGILFIVNHYSKKKERNTVL
jgi:prolipoprotein diacylglyceryltransferase